MLTDHPNLEYIRSAQRLNPRQPCWSLFFTRFNFSLTFRPGSKNVKADALSRLHDSSSSQNTPEPILSPQHIIAPIRWDVLEHIQQALPVDPAPQGTPGGKTYVPTAVHAQLLQWIRSSHPDVMSYSTSGLVLCVRKQNLPVNYPQAFWNPSPYLTDPGPTWLWILSLTFPVPKVLPLFWFQWISFPKHAV